MESKYYFVNNTNFNILARLCWAAASPRYAPTTATRCGLKKFRLFFYWYRVMFLYPVRKFKFGLYFYKKGSVFIFRGSGFNFLKGDRSKYSSAPGFFLLKGPVLIFLCTRFELISGPVFKYSCTRFLIFKQTGFYVFVHPVY